MIPRSPIARARVSVSASTREPDDEDRAGEADVEAAGLAAWCRDRLPRPVPG